MATLHVTNGDCAADIIRRVVADPVVITADVLHEGPAPAVDGDEWHKVRGEFLGDGHGAAISAELAATDRAIVEAARSGRIVLWFEHDLFDQLALIRVLDLVAGLKPRPAYEQPRPANAVSLICIDRFAGVDRFIGLGHLSTGQMATLVGTEQPVTVEQYTLASEAWAAFRSPDPRRLLAVAADADRCRPLPFLRDALLRFLAEFPSVDNGLSHTEQLMLGALHDAPLDAGRLFGDAQAREPRPFIGDWTFFDNVKRLASAAVPLVTVANGYTGQDLRGHTVAITDDGRRVLDGERDHIALNGIDLWRGGVHLAGRSPWRWDAKRETLVS